MIWKRLLIELELLLFPEALLRLVETLGHRPLLLLELLLEFEFHKLIQCAPVVYSGLHLVLVGLLALFHLHRLIAGVMLVALLRATKIGESLAAVVDYLVRVHEQLVELQVHGDLSVVLVRVPLLPLAVALGNVLLEELRVQGVHHL